MGRLADPASTKLSRWHEVAGVQALGASATDAVAAVAVRVRRAGLGHTAGSLGVAHGVDRTDQSLCAGKRATAVRVGSGIPAGVAHPSAGTRVALGLTGAGHTTISISARALRVANAVTRAGEAIVRTQGRPAASVALTHEPCATRGLRARRSTNSIAAHALTRFGRFQKADQVTLTLLVGRAVDRGGEAGAAQPRTGRRRRQAHSPLDTVEGAATGRVLDRGVTVGSIRTDSPTTAVALGASARRTAARRAAARRAATRGPPGARTARAVFSVVARPWSRATAEHGAAQDEEAQTCASLCQEPGPRVVIMGPGAERRKHERTQSRVHAKGGVRRASLLFSRSGYERESAGPVELSSA